MIGRKYRDLIFERVGTRGMLLTDTLDTTKYRKFVTADFTYSSFCILLLKKPSCKPDQNQLKLPRP